MIDIATLTKEDKSRNVVYKSGTGQEDYGQITSWNDKFIFVRYVSTSNEEGRATRPEDLRFMTEEEEDEFPEYLNALEEEAMDEED